MTESQIQSKRHTKPTTQAKQLLLKTPLKLTDYIKLDNGTAYLGFTHDTLNLNNMVSLDNWTFVSEARSN